MSLTDTAKVGKLSFKLRKVYAIKVPMKSGVSIT